MSERAVRRRPSPTRAIRRRVARLYRGMTSRQIVVERGPGWISRRGSNAVLLEGGASEPRRGIFLRGACDVPALFTLAPLLAGRIQGSVCIALDGSGVSAARSDQLLQTHVGVPDEFVQRVASRLDLARDYFAPTLFAPTFTTRGLEERGAYPKSVVVLSILPDLSRTIYRHRETGYLVDPGTAWLNNKLASALADLSFIEWFRSEFESAGRMSIDDFKANYRRLVPLIRSETGAHVLVLNTLDTDPLDTRYEYSQLNITRAVRRRKLNIALDELARELDFRVLDVDRVLKEEGVDRQVDFSHFPVERMRAVAAEAHRILVDLAVV